MLVGFAVPDVAAGDGPQPEPVHHLLRGDISPALRDIPLVFALIVDDRFLVLVAPLTRPGKIRALYAGMCYPWLGVVVKDPAIVNSAHTTVGIVLPDDLEKTIPVRHCLGLHQVELVGERPPYISVSGQPCHDITQITVVCFGVHILVAPAVIRVKENEVGFNAHIEQITDALFEMTEKLGIESAVIPVLERPALERIELRLILIIRVALRKDAHPHLVERCIFKRCQRLPLHRISLMSPGIAGRADLEIRRTIGVCEVPFLVYSDRAAIGRRWFNTGKLTFFAVQLPVVTLRGIRPLTHCIRHKADAIHAVAVVESFRLKNSAALFELGAQFYIDKWISAFRSI